MSIFDLLKFGSLDFTMAAYMSMMIGAGMNVFVSGETASGKTTLLNALNCFIAPDARLCRSRTLRSFRYRTRTGRRR